MTFEWEELADMAIEETESFIDAEGGFVSQEHILLERLISWDHIFAHLDERIPEEASHLHELSGEVARRLVEIGKMVESCMLKDLEILAEEKEVLTRLQTDAKHKKWRAVKRDLRQEAADERKVIRLELRELKKLHSKFRGLKRVMDRHALIAAINADLTDPKQKEEYQRLEEYYFWKIYKFIRIYEDVFKHLLEKEMELFSKSKLK